MLVTHGEAGVSAGQAMFMHIQSVDLDLSRYAKPDHVVDQLEHYKHGDNNICVNRDNSERLYSQKPCAASVEQALHYAVLSGTRY